MVKYQVPTRGNDKIEQPHVEVTSDVINVLKTTLSCYVASLSGSLYFKYKNTFFIGEQEKESIIMNRVMMG